MERKKIAIHRMSERRNDDFVPGTPAYRIGLVWQLTCEALSLNENVDTEQPLLRHVVRIVRHGEARDLADAEALELLREQDSGTTHHEG